jgi:hypothetical protein
MENEVHLFDGMAEGRFIAITGFAKYDFLPIQPAAVAFFPDQTMDLISFLDQGFDKMAADEPTTSGDQCFHRISKT